MAKLSSLLGSGKKAWIGRKTQQTDTSQANTGAPATLGDAVTLDSVDAQDVGAPDGNDGAMAMCLNHVPVHTIVLLGRWSSDAFLPHIRQQVTDFGSNVASKMIQTPRFHHVPPLGRDDPCSHNKKLISHLHLAYFDILGQMCIGLKNCKINGIQFLCFKVT